MDDTQRGRVTRIGFLESPTGLQAAAWNLQCSRPDGKNLRHRGHRNNHYPLPLGTVSSMCLLMPVSFFLLRNLRPLDPCGRMRTAAGGLCARESLKQCLGFSSFPGEEACRRRVRTGASSPRRPLRIVSDFCRRSTW